MQLNIKDNIFWYETAGDLEIHHGIHVGTYEAAQQTLNAREGTPIHGEWDGSRKYSTTLLRVRRAFLVAAEIPAGYNVDAPDKDYYSTGSTFCDDTPTAQDARPVMPPVRIVGKLLSYA